MGFVIGALFFLGILAGIQFVLKNRVGLFIEVNQVELKEFYTQEEGFFRSFGTFAFPNYLGVNALLYLPFPFFYLVQLAVSEKSSLSKKKLNWIKVAVVMCAFLLGVMVIVLSLSRWVIICFLLWVGVVLIVNKVLMKRYLVLLNKSLIVKGIASIFLLSSLTLISTLLIRLRSITTVVGRFDIVYKTIQLITVYPWFGVGPYANGRLAAAIDANYRNFAVTIPGAHNTIILVFADHGIFIGMGFLVLCYLFFRHASTYLFQSYVYDTWWLCALSWSGLLFLLNSLAYPLYGFDSSLEFFFLILAFFYSSKQLTSHGK